MKKISSDYPTYCTVDLKAIKHNLTELKRLALRNHFNLPSRKVKETTIHILAVVKADAYGHGMVEVAKLLEKQKVSFLAVSDVMEGKTLRNAGIKLPIVVFENVLKLQVKDIVEYDLIPTVCTFEAAKALNLYAKKRNKRVSIHIKVDTGMGRLGVWYKDAFDFVSRIVLMNNLIIHGLYTHFPCADTDEKYTKSQIQKLYNLVVSLDKKGHVIPYIHAANSAALAKYKTKILNVVRPGLMLYGLYPDRKLRRVVKLKPALEVKSKVIFVKELEKGRSVSYGQTFVAKHNMKVATIPIGYNDGYLRSFSNKARVIIDGKQCPVIGRVTMDQIVVDVSKVNKCKLNSKVIILGENGRSSIEADDLAQWSSTINYEVVCSLGNRLPRYTQR